MTTTDGSRGQRVVAYLAESNPDAIIWDGFDDAIIGVAMLPGRPQVAVYSRRKLIESLVGLGSSREEAEEHVSHNIEGSWLGENTPVTLHIPD